jgi:hypothetical protein
MDILSVLQMVFMIGLMTEAWKGNQKVFARAAIGSWFMILVLSQVGIDSKIVTYPLFFIGLTIGLWMYGLKLKCLVKANQG